MEKGKIIEKITRMLMADDKNAAREVILDEYPHKGVEIEKRSYTMTEKMEQFLRDGFIDRYTGEKLLNPGMLKVISFYFPEDFPFHPHWKMTHTHIAYWELIPTIDHIYPIAKGGQDNKENWVTTSMKNNSIKSNYTIDEIHWTLHPKGELEDWDGLTRMFIELVDNHQELLTDNYIKNWYNVSKKVSTMLDKLLKNHKGHYETENVIESLSSIKNDKYDEIKDENNDDNPLNSLGDAWVFVSGKCHLFSLALAEEFGYRAVEIRRKDGRLIHCFCETIFHGKYAYVDVRGITIDFNEFFKPFYNIHHDDYELPYVQDLEETLRFEETGDKEGYEFAKAIIAKYHSDYETE